MPIREQQLKPVERVISERFPDMPAAMGMIRHGIASLVIKLIDESHRHCANYPDRKGWKKITPVHFISYPSPNQPGKDINDDQQNWGYDQISLLHARNLRLWKRKGCLRRSLSNSQ